MIARITVLALLLCVSQCLFMGDSVTCTYDIDIDTSKVLSKTEDEYLSFTLDFSLKLDPGHPWYTLNFTHPRVHTLAKGLAPAILRFGGGRSDYAIFYNVTSRDEQRKIIELNKLAVDENPLYGYLIAIFPQDIDNLYQLARSAGENLLYDLNIELRYGPQWDSTNARKIMKYVIEKGYSDYIDFELGNEPPYKKFGDNAFNATGERLGKDFLILRKILDAFPEFKQSRLVGPDAETPRDGTYSGDVSTIMRDFVTTVQHNVSAITAHHYYFNGPTATIQQFFNISYFKLLESTLPKLRQTVYEAAKGPIDMWIGETADSNQGGTPDVTDSYASGFLWLDKLGLAAANEFKLVARQAFYGYNSTENYPLLNPSLYPNPDYWLSYVFKKLVGRNVLNVTVKKTDYDNEQHSDKSSNSLLRGYAHCVSPRAGYKPGSIVFYAVNLNITSSAIIKFSDRFINYTMNLYLLTPENGDIKSKSIQLNGKTLKLVDDYTFPDLKPMPLPFGSVTFPPLTYGFIVLATKNDTYYKDLTLNIC